MKRERIYCAKCDFVEVDTIGKLGSWFVHKRHRCNSNNVAYYNISHTGSGLAAIIGLPKHEAMALLFELLEYEEDIRSIYIDKDSMGKFEAYKSTDRGKALIRLVRGYRKENKA